MSENEKMPTRQLNRIKVVLVEQNRSGKWLAEQMGKAETTVSRWAQNKIQPSVEQLYDIADILKVDVKSLLNSNSSNGVGVE
jgi:putative transcriptional regulator